MKSYIFGVAMILLIISHSSCFQMTLSNSMHKQELLPFDSKWEKTLKSRTDSLKEKSIDFFMEDLSFFREKGLNYSKEDFQKLSFVPLVVFHIDSKSFQNYNGKLSKNDLSIDTSKVTYFAYKEKKLIILVEIEFLNGIVDNYNCGVYTEPLSSTYSKLDKNEMKSVCEIDVTCSPKSSHRRKYAAFIDKSGQLMYIDGFGRILSFEKEMQSLKESMHSDEQ